MVRGAVSVRVLPPGELEAWRGADPFSMRQKLEAARAVMPTDGALVFLDADTVATTSLAPLAAGLDEGAVFMHKQEFALGSSPRAGNRRLWAQLEGKAFGPWQFAPADAMWNSGVIALPSSGRSRLDDAVGLYDTMAAAGIRHFATEQLVLGLVLARTGRLRSAERWFTHYWGNKQKFDGEIARRLDEWHRRKLTPHAAADIFRANPIQLPPNPAPARSPRSAAGSNPVSRDSHTHSPATATVSSQEIRRPGAHKGYRALATPVEDPPPLCLLIS